MKKESTRSKMELNEVTFVASPFHSRIKEEVITYISENTSWNVKRTLLAFEDIRAKKSRWCARRWN